MKSLTEKEKACLVYGFARGLAQAAKDDGFFKEWTVDKIVQEYLKCASKLEVRSNTYD